MSDFLGRGWAFPILPDAGGSLRYVAEDDNVAPVAPAAALHRPSVSG